MVEGRPTGGVGGAGDVDDAKLRAAGGVGCAEGTSVDGVVAWAGVVEVSQGCEKDAWVVSA